MSASCPCIRVDITRTICELHAGGAYIGPATLLAPRHLRGLPCVYEQHGPPTAALGVYYDYPALFNHKLSEAVAKHVASLTTCVGYDAELYNDLFWNCSAAQFQEHWLPRIFDVPQQASWPLMPMLAMADFCLDEAQALEWSLLCARQGCPYAWYLVGKFYAQHGRREASYDALLTFWTTSCASDKMRFGESALYDLVRSAPSMEVSRQHAAEYDRRFKHLHPTAMACALAEFVANNPGSSRSELMTCAAVFRRHQPRLFLDLCATFPGLFSVYVRILDSAPVRVPDDFVWRYVAEECVACLCDRPDVGFFPCLHRVLCSDCLFVTACPVCRSEIEAWVLPDDSWLKYCNLEMAE